MSLLRLVKASSQKSSANPKKKVLRRATYTEPRRRRVSKGMFVRTLKSVGEMQSLQRPEMTLTMKKGVQQRRKTPMMMPIVMAALCSWGPIQ